jgi:2-isopropylmalate synthase
MDNSIPEPLLADSGKQGVHPIDVPVNFNWNSDQHPLSLLPDVIPGEPTPLQAAQTEILSECLRDGLQGITAYPSLEMMLQYVEMLSNFGIKYATVGIYPGGADKISATIKELLACMRDDVPSITPTVLSLCTPASLNWTAECKEIHPALESIVFMGSAPSRRLVQGWDLDFILRNLATYISKTVQLGIPVIAGTEHSTQTSPDDLRQITTTQVENGAYAVAVADTIGTIRPCGTYRFIRFIRTVLEDLGMPNMQLDWHGHRDTGNALSNSMMAVAAGANRIHVVSRGVGERSGNASLEEVVINLAAIEEEAGLPVSWNMSQLLGLISFYQEMVGVEPPEHGVLGKRYSHTSSGIHTDAILKANDLAEKARKARDFNLERSLREMARTVYSAIDPATVGGSMTVGVSPWSGRSSVKLACMHSGRDPKQLTDEAIEKILARANHLGRELEDKELEDFFAESEAPSQP